MNIEGSSLCQQPLGNPINFGGSVNAGCQIVEQLVTGPLKNVLALILQSEGETLPPLECSWKNLSCKIGDDVKYSSFLEGCAVTISTRLVPIMFSHFFQQVPDEFSSFKTVELRIQDLNDSQKREILEQDPEKLLLATNGSNSLQVNWKGDAGLKDDGSLSQLCGDINLLPPFSEKVSLKTEQCVHIPNGFESGDCSCKAMNVESGRPWPLNLFSKDIRVGIQQDCKKGESLEVRWDPNTEIFKESPLNCLQHRVACSQSSLSTSNVTNYNLEMSNPCVKDVKSVLFLDAFMRFCEERDLKTETSKLSLQVKNCPVLGDFVLVGREKQPSGDFHEADVKVFADHPLKDPQDDQKVEL